MTSCIRLKSILYINFALIISFVASSGGQSLNYWPANLCEFQCGTIFSLCTFIKNPSNVKPPNYDLHSAFSWRNFTHFLSHLQAPISIPISIPIPFPFRFPYPFPLPPLRGVIRKRREPELGSGFWVWDSDWAWAWAWAVAPVGVRVPVQFSSVQFRVAIIIQNLVYFFAAPPFLSDSELWLHMKEVSAFSRYY